MNIKTVILVSNTQENSRRNNNKIKKEYILVNINEIKEITAVRTNPKLQLGDKIQRKKERTKGKALVCQEKMEKERRGSEGLLPKEKKIETKIVKITKARHLSYTMVSQ